MILRHISHLSTNKQIDNGNPFPRKNYILFCINEVLYNLAATLSTGTIIQMFLGSLGISSAALGSYSAICNAVNILITILLSRITERSHKTCKTLFWLAIPISLTYLGLLLPCQISTGKTGLIFGVTLTLGILQSFFAAIRTIFDYKLPCEIIRIKDFGMVSSAVGVICGITGIFSGIIVSRLTAGANGNGVYIGLFAVSAALMIVSGLLCLRMKPVTVQKEEEAAKKIKLTKLFRMPAFSWLIIPNLFRGMATGIIGLAAVFALDEGYSTENTALLVTAASAASILGSLLYMLLSRRFSARLLTLAGCAGMLLMPLMTGISSGGFKLFLIFYFLSMVFRYLIDYGVPTMLYQIVTTDTAGTFHAWRLLISTAGTTLAAAAGSALIGKVPSELLLGAAAALQFLGGIGYYLAVTACLHKGN